MHSYELSLRFEMEEKQDKECIVKWAKNFGDNIQMDQWERR